MNHNLLGTKTSHTPDSPLIRSHDSSAVSWRVEPWQGAGDADFPQLPYGWFPYLPFSTEPVAPARWPAATTNSR